MKFKRFSFFTILVGLFLSLTMSHSDRLATTKNSMKNIGDAIDMYYEKNGKVPEANSIHQLKNSLVPGYIKECPSKDAWGRDLFYFTRSSGDARKGDRGEYWLGSGGSNDRFNGFLCHMLKVNSNNQNIVFSNGSFISLPDKRI
jgi:hypothetical protein